MGNKLISLMIDEELYKNLKSRCLAKEINVKDFIAQSIQEKLYENTTPKTTKRSK